METLWSKTSIVSLLSRRVVSDNEFSSSSNSVPTSRSMSGLITTSDSGTFSIPALEEMSSFLLTFSRFASGVSVSINPTFALTSVTVAE